MTNKVVIAGSSSLQKKVMFWKNYWQNKGYSVIDYPSFIPEDSFLEKYPEEYKEFFKNIIQADTLFVMNEDKNNIQGYIGAETFAEICFGIAQNLIYNKSIEIILLKMPGKNVQSYDEIKLWLKLGWIKLYKE